jgi:hypothetical protein
MDGSMYDMDVLSGVDLPSDLAPLLLLVVAEDWSTFPRCRLGHPSTDSTGTPIAQESDGAVTDTSKAAVSGGISSTNDNSRYAIPFCTALYRTVFFCKYSALYCSTAHRSMLQYILRPTAECLAVCLPSIFFSPPLSSASAMQ